MIVYRKKMQDCHISERDIQLIQRKSIEFRAVEVKDIMIIDNREYKCATPSFNLDDLIIAQVKYVERCRPQAEKRNVELLAILRKLRDDLIKKDLVKRVQG